MDKLWNRYSSWYRLLKAIAWIRRFIRWRFGTKEDTRYRESRLSVRELEEARLAILRCLQKRHFAEELKALQGSRQVRRSEVSRLEPHLDTDGLIRVGGRLNRAILQPDQKNPILLPREGKISELIVRATHVTKAGHSGREHTLAAVRETYWIPKCRRLLNRVLKNCVTCRRTNWRHTRQRQADLPEDRLLPRNRPFTYTGVDCFGPILIKQGRARPKRWGCLFTCLTTRAIHLEVLGSLSADSFIAALTRFTGRRGPPKRIRSDNGTNMIGACRELKEAVSSWHDNDTVRDSLLHRQVEWRFNPPTASHMGGVWERQIRTVKGFFRL